MTDGNADDADRRTTLPRAEHVPAAPHILIAEDQTAIQELLCWMLQLAEYRTTVCTRRQAVLTWRNKAMPSGDDPALILLDLSLLCTNEAADFLHHLRTRWQDVGYVLPQVIVLTTSKQVQVELGMRECVLQKPFHVWELLALIRQVIPVASGSEEGSLQEEQASDL